jgi:hypothetical protein
MSPLKLTHFRMSIPTRALALAKSWLLALVCFAALSPQVPGAPNFQPQDRDAAATTAYRSGDLATARTLWEELLGDTGADLDDGQRGRLCYNMGTLCMRESRQLEAVAWFSAALRLRPRDEDTWANLELARLESGLEAADRGDLKATIGRLLSTWTAAESSLLALIGCLPLALALGYEALRGGRRSKALVLLGFVVWLLAIGPWVRHIVTDGQRNVMVMAEKGAAARSEPRPDATRVEKLDAGTIVPHLDEIPGWMEVRLDGKRRAWIEDSDLFQLNR